MKICDTSFRAYRSSSVVGLLAVTGVGRTHLKLETPDVVHEKLEEVIRVDFLSELGDNFGLRLGLCDWIGSVVVLDRTDRLRLTAVTVQKDLHLEKVLGDVLVRL